MPRTRSTTISLPERRGCPYEHAQGVRQGSARRRSRRSATRTSARTSRRTSCAACSPMTSARRGRCSIRAIRASTRSSSGRARTSRTQSTSRCRSFRSTSRRRLHPKVIVENLRETAAAGEPEPELTLFDDFNGYRVRAARRLLLARAVNWSNRLILGDSLLVMTSLAEKEGLRGKVQTIYLDPPYGIKFGSQLAGVHAEARRDGREGRVMLTRQPEQIRAFRDTWELGIHSYLTLSARPARGRARAAQRDRVDLRSDRRRECPSRSEPPRRGLRQRELRLTDHLLED